MHHHQNTSDQKYLFFFFIFGRHSFCSLFSFLFLLFIKINKQHCLYVCVCVCECRCISVYLLVSLINLKLNWLLSVWSFQFISIQIYGQILYCFSLSLIIDHAREKLLFFIGLLLNGFKYLKEVCFVGVCHFYRMCNHK